MNTDACLGYGAMGYQSWEVAREICDARRFILIRHVGPVAKGRDATSQSLAHKTEVRFCLCCVKATHIAVPMSSELGAYSWLKETGVKIGTSEGPSAGRRLAAVYYVLDSYGAPLPVGWDWAARPLEFAARNALIHSILRGVPAPIPTIADTEMQKQNLEKDLDAKITAMDSQGNATHPTIARAPTIPGETPISPR